MYKKILAIILARGGSKRLKNKNIKVLQNKPLINWTIDVATKSKKFCDIIVSSDSEKILKIAKSFNGKILTLKRSKKISNDKATSEVAIRHALKWYEKKFTQVHYIVLLQPTSPFRTLKTIKKCLKEIKNPKINIVITVKKMNSEGKQKRLFQLVKNKFCLEKRVFKQNKTKYITNGLLYLIKKSFFEKNKNLTPSRFKPVIINSKKENIDIDTINDWNYAQKFIK